MIEKEKVCVYDIILNNEVVYVGMTNNPARRQTQHRKTGICSDGAELVVHKWYEYRYQAAHAERMRQLELRPSLCKDIPIYDYPRAPKGPRFDWQKYRRELAEAISKISEEDIAEGARRFDEMMRNQDRPLNMREKS